MKSAKHRPKVPTTDDILRGAGGRTSRRSGWRGHLGRHPEKSPLQNPRTPAAPASLDLNLAEYFTAAALMGLLASQRDEPNKQWVQRWTFEMGEAMASEAHRRRNG